MGITFWYVICYVKKCISFNRHLNENCTQLIEGSCQCGKILYYIVSSIMTGGKAIREKRYHSLVCKMMRINECRRSVINPCGRINYGGGCDKKEEKTSCKRWAWHNLSVLLLIVNLSNMWYKTLNILPVGTVVVQNLGFFFFSFLFFVIYLVGFGELDLKSN